MFSQPSFLVGRRVFLEDPSGFALHAVTDGSGQEDGWLIQTGFISVLSSSAEDRLSSYKNEPSLLLLHLNAGWLVHWMIGLERKQLAIIWTLCLHILITDAKQRVCISI